MAKIEQGNGKSFVPREDLKKKKELLDGFLIIMFTGDTLKTLF